MTTKPFIDDDFLLETDLARALYHEVAAKQPIIDYHCHLPPDQIAQNHRFRTLTEIWLAGDHYKWRAMRTNGVNERFCTGDATDWEKFEAWANTVPDTLRNPLFHWTHMELKDPFGIADRLLDGKSARYVYDHCNELLARDEFTTQGLLRHFRVLVVCTTDDPADSLEHHVAYAKSVAKGGAAGKATGAGNDGAGSAKRAASPRMYPTFRPDKSMAVEDLEAYNGWLGRLEAASQVSIGTFASLLDALDRRHEFFHSLGCRLSDHGLETVYAEPCSDTEADTIFQKARTGRALSADEVLKIKSAILHHLCLLDHERGWVQQFHLGALRNNNTRMMRTLGPDTGFDSIGDFEIARPLARLFDRLDATNQLARTILYNLNPRDNEAMATMLGNFQDGTVPGKLQFGSSWWFLDQLDGMEKQMNALSNMGLLSRFVGMLTDSRSFLSYSRHDYFRRLLCNILGNDARRGLVPSDRALLGKLVENVCFQNAKGYFAFEVPTT